MVKRFRRRITALPLLLLFILIYFTVKLVPLFTGVYAFLGTSIIIASLAVIAALHGVGVGVLTALLLALLDNCILPLTSTMPSRSLTTFSNILTAFSVYQSFTKGIIVAGIVGLIVDTPEKIGRIALWTYVSLLIYQAFFGAVLGDIDYFLETVLPRASLELISASLLTIPLVFPFSFLAFQINKKLTVKTTQKVEQSLP